MELGEMMLRGIAAAALAIVTLFTAARYPSAAAFFFGTGLHFDGPVEAEIRRLADRDHAVGRALVCDGRELIVIHTRLAHALASDIDSALGDISSHHASHIRASVALAFRSTLYHQRSSGTGDGSYAVVRRGSHVIVYYERRH